MDLILWRHAEAGDGVPDSERELTSKGLRQAKAMARWLEPRLPKGTRVITSPARRCQQTAAALTGEFEQVATVGVGASSSGVLKATGWPEARTAFVVVGHQPTLGRVAALLLTGEEADLSVKKGGVWWFSSRLRDGEPDVVLEAVLSPNLA